MRFLRYALPVFALALASNLASAAGLLIPEDKKLPPLAMVNHKVTVAVEDQVATTTVEQTFRNHTDRQLEATYVFPVPKGASVRKFAMWVDGKELVVKGGGLTATKGTIYGAPDAPLTKGTHVAVAYGRTAVHATAVAWSFRVA